MINIQIWQDCPDARIHICTNITRTAIATAIKVTINYKRELSCTITGSLLTRSETKRRNEHIQGA